MTRETKENAMGETNVDPAEIIAGLHSLSTERRIPIDITPTWSGILFILTDQPTSRDREIRETAAKELLRMAHLADLFVQSQKSTATPS